MRSPCVPGQRCPRRLQPGSMAGTLCVHHRVGSVAGTPVPHSVPCPGSAKGFVPPVLAERSPSPAAGLAGCGLLFPLGLLVFGVAAVCGAWTGLTRAQGLRVTLNKST